MEIPRGRGFQNPIFLNESATLKWNFQRGGGFNLKNLPWVGYGYFPEQHITANIICEGFSLFCFHNDKKVASQLRNIPI